MRTLIGTAMMGAVLALGVGTTAPASADTVVVKKVRGVCYDSDGDRVPCRRSTTYRSHYYTEPGYRYRDPGVSVEFGARERRYRYRDRYWD
jgi:hypothetical protein